MIELRNKKHKLFGDRAERVSTEEMSSVFQEIRIAISTHIDALVATTSLADKTSHGDVDLVYIPRFDRNIRDTLMNAFGESILDESKNGDVYSILFDSKSVGKHVHVDFIKANEKNFRTKLQYFSYNDFSGVVGMFSKKLKFKYGSEGFFKRFRDKRGNFHDILISYDLRDGLRILGFDATKFDELKTVDDIVAFMLTSPMFDSSMVKHKELNQSDKKSMKRPVVEYVVSKLREANAVATVTNEDYFFHKLFPEKDIEVVKECLRIDESVTPKFKKYDGNWITSTFKLKPGPLVGSILKYL